MTELTHLLYLLIGLTVGFLWGNHRPLIDDVTKITETVKNIKKATQEELKPGVYHRPTVADINRRNEPVKTREAKEAMKEVLDQMPEIQEHKRLLEK